MKRRGPEESLEQGRSVEAEAGQKNMTKEETLLLEGIEEDLRDFLAADILDVDADPAFKEKLRKELWELVQRRSKARRAARKLRGDSEGD